MSADAISRVKSYTHPKVKGCARVLLERIAEVIPEGQTMTALMPIEELATPIGYYDQAVRKARNVLVDVGVLRIVGGGRGRPASYELLLLPGAGGDPLLRLFVPVPPRTRPSHLSSGPDLFTQVGVVEEEEGASDGPVGDRRANNVGEKYRRWVTNVGDFHRRWIAKIGTFHRRWRTRVNDIGEKYRRWMAKFGTFHRPLLPQGVDVTDSATTTYVRSEKDPDPEVEKLVVVDARAREPADEFLDWFEQTYPHFHHGAVCLVHRPRHRVLVQQLLERPRTDLAHLRAMTVLMWSLTSDGVVGSDFWWIATQVTVRDVFVLHRKANFLDLEVRRRQQQQTPEDAAADIWTRVLERLETRLDRHSFYKWVRPTTLAHLDGDVLTVTADAEAVAWLQKHYQAVIDQAIAEVRPGARVEFVAAAVQQQGYG